MKKIVLLLITMAVVLGVLYVFFMLFTRKSNNANNPPTETNFPTSDGTGVNDNLQKSDQIIPVRTVAGDTVPVRDFRKDQFVEAIADNTYILRDTTSPNTATFEVLYFGSDGHIVISLRKEPLRDTRIIAETALMRHLNTTHEELCNFAISVRVARDINEFYAGQELGVSNCPRSQPL